MPANDPCDLVMGSTNSYCRGDNSAPAVEPPELDPLTSFAKSAAKGAAWLVEHMGKAIDGPASVDFTNAGFLAQYAIVFAASTVLTLVLWLIAVAKRAVRGVPFTTAIGEAVGLLWLAVLASAFTPLVLQVTVGAVDAVTAAVAGTSGSSVQLFTSMAAALRQGGENLGGGPFILLIVSLVTILLAGLLWLVLVLRSVTLYVGAILGTVVYAALVDRDLWGKVRRWAGMMVALILIKPIIAIALGIAAVFTAEEGPGTTPVVVAGIVVIILALAASVAIFKFVPGYGDEIRSGLAFRAAMAGGRMAKAGVKAGASTAGVMSQGIQTHGSRSPSQGGGKKGGTSSVAEGIQAHGLRGGKENPSK